MEGFVYKWVNNLNGKWYIGKCNGRNKSYKAGGVNIRKAFDKYGLDNFTKYILYTGEDFELVEKLALESHDAANDHKSYNATNKGRGRPAGFTASDATKRKMSKAKLGKPRSEATKEKVRKTLTGSKLSEERKAKISATLTGNKLSEETKAKISAALRSKNKKIWD